MISVVWKKISNGPNVVFFTRMTQAQGLLGTKMSFSTNHQAMSPLRVKMPQDDAAGCEKLDLLVY